MGQEKIPFSEGTDCGLEGFTGHPPGEQHTREVSVADDAGCPEPGAAKALRSCSTSHLTRPPSARRRPRASAEGERAEARAWCGSSQFRVVATPHPAPAAPDECVGDHRVGGDFTGELLIPLQLMTDGPFQLRPQPAPQGWPERCQQEVSKAGRQIRAVLRLRALTEAEMQGEGMARVMERQAATAAGALGPSTSKLAPPSCPAFIKSSTARSTPGLRPRSSAWRVGMPASLR